MKVEVKQACEIEGKTFGPNIHKKPGIFTMPGLFLLVHYFGLLLAEGKLKILELSEQDLKEVEEASTSDKFKDVEPHPAVQAAIDSMSIKEEGDTDGDEELGDSADGNDDDSDASGSEGTEESEDESEDEGSEEPLNADEIKLREEYEALHEKAKRLNKTERKRYEVIKKKLNIKE